MQGNIKHWKFESGYGFIKVDGGPDVFVHKKQLPGFDHLLPGQKVEFETEANWRNGKTHAVNVKVLSPILHRPEPLDDAEAHMRLAQTTFMKP